MSHQHSAENTPASATESSRREQLAVYFLSVPPYSELNEAQKDEYRQRLRELNNLEHREVMEAAGHHRPLTYDNPIPFIQNLLTAAQQLAAGTGQPLLLFPAKGVNIDFHAMLHPRLLSIAVCALLRMACNATPRETVWVRLQEQENCLTITATAAQPFYDPAIGEVIKECAKLHGGSLARCDRSVGFSLSRITQPPREIRHSLCPTVEELLRDTLSPLWTGFYAWLPLLSEENSNPSEGTSLMSKEE